MINRSSRILIMIILNIFVAKANSDMTITKIPNGYRVTTQKGLLLECIESVDSRNNAKLYMTLNNKPVEYVLVNNGTMTLFPGGLWKMCEDGYKKQCDILQQKKGVSCD